MKLLVFVKSIDGGTGTYINSLFKINRFFGKKAIRIRVIVLENPSYRKEKYGRNIIFLRKADYYNLRYSFKFKYIKDFFEELYWINLQITKFSPEIVLGIDLHCNLIVSIINSFNKKFRTILTTHINLKDNIETRSDLFLKLILNKLTSFFFNKTNKLVFVSKQLENDFIKTFFVKKNLCSTIYNGINTMKIVRYPSSNFGNKTIITLARLVEQKDHLTLFKSFALLLKKIPKAELLILSRGREETTIKTCVENYHFSNKIKFLGWVPNIFTYIKKSSIFVFSSKREGFGYALVEAMSQGIPVISTDTPFGPREILDGGKYGILVPMKNPQAMADAMYELLTDKKKYRHYSQKSLERAWFFSERKMLINYKKIILELFRENNS